jgi:hypothetical protein
MEIWSEIRREVLTGALSKRAAIAKYGVGWHTLKKMLAHDEPPGCERPPQPILTAQIASRVDLVHPISKEAGHGAAGRSAEVCGMAAAAAAI